MDNCLSTAPFHRGHNQCLNINQFVCRLWVDTWCSHNSQVGPILMVFDWMVVAHKSFAFPCSSMVTWFCTCFSWRISTRYKVRKWAICRVCWGRLWHVDTAIACTSTSPVCWRYAFSNTTEDVSVCNVLRIRGSTTMRYINSHYITLGYITFHKRVFDSCRLHSICRQIGRDVTTRPVTVIILEFLTIPQR